MNFTSTRNAALKTGFSDAVIQGIAPDGDLYVPDEWPRLADAIGAERLAGLRPR